MTVTLEPLVSTAWLDARLDSPVDGPPAESEPGGPQDRLIVVDLREPHLYEAGHIPGSVSIPLSPMSEWAVSDDDLLMELPPAADLFAALGARGIDPGSRVVLVTTVEPPPAPAYALADGPRAAATLHYAGVTDVAILDGGYPRWAAEGRRVTTEPASPVPKEWTGPVVEGVFVSTEYVKARLGKALLVDGRDPDQFFGVTPCPFAGVGGHMPGARSLPVPWVWQPDGTYKPSEVLLAMVEGVLGPDRDQEIIAYCGVGGYAATIWFLLTRMFGYRDVRIYDGSAEAWVKGEEMVSYSW